MGSPPSARPSPSWPNCPKCEAPVVEVTKSDETWMECDECGWDSRVPEREGGYV